jgi:leucyl-tRNA synthetase
MNFTTFTTRPDTIFGVTFIVIAPENPVLLKITKPQYLQEVQEYINKTKAKSERERQVNKEKTGVFTGSYAIHPLTKAKIPIWTADYVLYNYGTGVIMAVPAHDERDFEFAKKYDLEIKPVIFPKNQKELDISEKPYLKKGILQNCDQFNGLNSKEASFEIAKVLKSKNQAADKINYKFRDWVFSRQRYWGEPFPFEYLKTS